MRIEFRVPNKRKIIRYGLLTGFFVCVALVAIRTASALKLLQEGWHSQLHPGIDSLIIGVLLVGCAGYAFGFRKFLDLRREQGRRTLAESKADWITYHDFLTRLPNRRFLEEKAPDIVETTFGKSGYGVLAFDLDGFKKVNETVGPDGGDMLLMDLARRLSGFVPEAKILRLGSDEFLVIAGCTTSNRCQNCSDPEQTRKLAEDLISLLNMPFDIKGTQISVGACVGLSSYPEHGLRLKDVVKQAILALSVAKRQGRNSYVEFQPEINEDLARRTRIESQLRSAVANGDIVPYYQPLVELKTGAIVGFEALARWNTPEDGFIPPDLFIRIAENTGLISELSEHLLRQACKDAREWPTQVRLAFNISPRMLEDRHLGLKIFKILGETGLSPHRLEIEITESALVRDTELAATMIRDLRGSGVRVVLDDFGTGYSSLAQLSALTFDKIKIDRIFVSGLEQDEKKSKIVRTTVALATGLGITTTAEGIEQESQLDDLKQLGCSFGQGYLFGKAVPQEQALALLSAGPASGTQQSRQVSA
jgi:diguanylate cyclase (GGDEF)-like protein